MMVVYVMVEWSLQIVEVFNRILFNTAYENVELKLEPPLEQAGTYMRRKKQYLCDFVFVFMLLWMSPYYDELRDPIIDMHIMFFVFVLCVLWYEIKLCAVMMRLNPMRVRVIEKFI